MKNITISLLSLFALTSSPLSQAVEVAGVQFPDTYALGNKTLVAAGWGLRTASVFKIKIFSAVIYADKKGYTAEEYMNQARPLVFREVYLRDVPKSMSAGPFKEILTKVAGADLPAVESEIARFAEWYPSFEKGGGFTVIWTQDKTRIEHQAKEGVVAPFESTRKFGDVLTRVWFGPSGEEDLKKALLNPSSP